MFIDLKDFREKYHITQDEIAWHLKVSSSLVGKVENGHRKLPQHARELLQQLAEKYNYTASDPKILPVKAGVQLLKQGAKELIVQQYQRYITSCQLELIDLKRKLRLLPKKYRKYQDMLTMAEEQLESASPEDLRTDHFIIIAHKKNVAQKHIDKIIKENPVLIALKIVQLENFLATEAAAQLLKPDNWLKFEDMLLLPSVTNKLDR